MLDSPPWLAVNRLISGSLPSPQRVGKALTLTALAAVTTSLMVSCGGGDGAGGEDSAADEPEAEPARFVQEWPLFRRNTEMHGDSEEDLVPPLELAWTFEPEVEEGKRLLPFKSSPVISQGHIYVGGLDAKLYCLNLEDGSKVWEFKAEGPITGSAAVVDGKVFFGCNFGFIYGLDAETGAEIWRTETDDKIEGGVNFLMVEDPQKGEGKQLRLFVGSHDFFLYCLMPETGEVRWKVETENLVNCAPSIAENLPAVTFGGCDGFLHVVSAVDGSEMQKVDLGSGAYVASTSPVANGISYIAHHGGEILAVDVATGETIWKVTGGRGAEYQAAPAVDAKHVYVAGRGDKRLVALDRVTGNEVWGYNVSRDLDSSPVVCASAVYQAGMDGRVYALSPADGAELWNFDAGAQFTGSPAISGGKLVICGEDGLVYAFNESESAAPSGSKAENAAEKPAGS